MMKRTLKLAMTIDCMDIRDVEGGVVNIGQSHRDRKKKQGDSGKKPSNTANSPKKDNRPQA